LNYSEVPTKYAEFEPIFTPYKLEGAGWGDTGKIKYCEEEKLSRGAG
jgi:hypothetical protein